MRLPESLAPLPQPTEVLTASILLVDDEASNVKLLERTLRLCQRYQVDSTTDPRTVLERTRRHVYDLIILDLNMPYLDGFQVMRQLRALEAGHLPPILVVTAQHDQEHRVRALHEGAADYVTKPFQVDELLARVRNLINARLY